jgi:hypothetical protein
VHRRTRKSARAGRMACDLAPSVSGGLAAADAPRAQTPIHRVSVIQSRAGTSAALDRGKTNALVMRTASFIVAKNPSLTHLSLLKMDRTTRIAGHPTVLIGGRFTAVGGPVQALVYRVAISGPRLRVTASLSLSQHSRADQSHSGHQKETLLAPAPRNFT